MTTPLRSRVFLPSIGLNERRATLHTYSHSELVTLKNVGGTKTTGMGHMYKCSETGELRRFGFDCTFPKDDGAN